MSRFGAKANALLKLQVAGFSIPAFSTLGSEWMQEHLARCGLSGEPDQSWSKRITETPLSNSLLTEIGAHLPAGERFAVRSSALAEDGTQYSFAGQFASKLNVPLHQVPDAVRQVWSSAFHYPVLDYCTRNQLPSESLQMGVLIQQMLEPEISGVAFAINPVTGDRHQALVSAVYGLGVGLVSGDLDADRFALMPDNSVQQTLAEKPHHWISLADGSTSRQPVSDDLRRRATLDHGQARKIGQLARTLSETLGCWQDIEWCLCQDRLWLLQSRPITNLAQLPDPNAHESIWDNANIVESYPGITTPLTFSFVRDIYSRVYRQFAGIMGIEQSLIDSNQSIFEMLGFFNGRIYYNLLNWYRILSLLPGYRINAGFMEQMMGVDKNFSVPPPPVPATGNHWARLFRSLFGITRSWWMLKAESRRFFQRVERELRIFQQTDLDGLDLQGLHAVYQRLEDQLLAHWKAPLVNDFFAMIFFGVLRKCIGTWCPTLGNEFQNDLLIAEQNIVSTEPPRRLAKLAEQCRNSPQLMAAAQHEDAAAVLAAMQNEPRIQLEFNQLREQFGARTLEELKLETITATQDPTLLAAQLIPYICNSHVHSLGWRTGGSSRRSHAERAFHKALGHSWRRPIGRWLLTRTRRLVSGRENLRLERTRVFDAARCIFLAMGRCLAMDSVIPGARDIFWLTRQELFDYIQGTAVATDLGQLVEQRRAQWAAYDDVAIPDRFHTRGAPGFAGMQQWSSQEIKPAPDTTAEQELQGTGCCRGVVTAEVVVVENPRQCNDLNGKILVARQTDPGWVPLFPLSSGLLVERGSLLSHSAIVAREMGIPAVVAVKGLLRTLRTGDRVTLDGSTGRIQIHPRRQSTGKAA